MRLFRGTPLAQAMDVNKLDNLKLIHKGFQGVFP
jgi:hypothetical protein